MQFILPFIIAMALTMTGLPLLGRLAGKWRIVDHPGVRKIHSTPIPRVGGLAMAFAVLLAAVLSIHLAWPDIWFLIAAGVIVLFGAIDDRFDSDYRVKLVGQLTAVCIVMWMGDVRVQSVIMDDRLALPGWVSVPLTLVFLVGVTNAINLADGLDGLAGGTTFLSLCAVALLSSIGGAGPATALALAFAGAVLGFLRFNTYPASVFMGDAGSQLLGFAVGVLAVRVTQSETSEIAATIPILLLALPILDTLSVMVQRIGEGRSPFSADKNHIHHKLLALGFDHHEAVVVIYAVQAMLFVFAYLLRFEADWLVLLVVSVIFLTFLAVFQIATRTGWQFRVRPDGVGALPVSRLLSLLRRLSLLPRLCQWAIAGSVGLYAAITVVDGVSMSMDFKILIVALLVLMLGSLVIRRLAPLSLIEKAALYVTVTLLVYLDAVLLPVGRTMSIVGWIAVAIAGVATAVRLRFYSDRRFELTSLDLLVLFMALVVPSLPGTLSLPHGGALAIAKLVVLFYALEILISGAEKNSTGLRIAAVAVLAGLTLGGLLIL